MGNGQIVGTYGWKLLGIVSPIILLHSYGRRNRTNNKRTVSTPAMLFLSFCLYHSCSQSFLIPHSFCAVLIVSENKKGSWLSVKITATRMCALRGASFTCMDSCRGRCLSCDSQKGKRPLWAHWAGEWFHYGLNPHGISGGRSARQTRWQWPWRERRKDTSDWQKDRSAESWQAEQETMEMPHRRQHRLESAHIPLSIKFLWT